MSKVLICVQDELLLPTKHQSNNIGRDCYNSQDVVIESGEIIDISIGVKCKIPIGRCGQVSPTRLLSQTGLLIVGGTHYINPQYFGEIKIQVVNLMEDTIFLEKNQNLFSLHFHPYLVGYEGNMATDYPVVEAITDRRLYSNFDKEFI